MSSPILFPVTVINSLTPQIRDYQEKTFRTAAEFHGKTDSEEIPWALRLRYRSRLILAGAKTFLRLLDTAVWHDRIAVCGAFEISALDSGSGQVSVG